MSQLQFLEEYLRNLVPTSRDSDLDLESDSGDEDERRDPDGPLPVDRVLSMTFDDRVSGAFDDGHLTHDFGLDRGHLEE